MLKMSSKIYFSFLLLSVCFSFGQVNLVPNPSFEDTIMCPSTLDQINYSTGWLPFTHSPDYFNTCSSIGACNAPYTPVGFQLPYHGGAFAGTITCASYAFPNLREFIGIQLLQSLNIGQKYFVTFQASLAAPPRNCWSNKIGAKFTTYNYTAAEGDMALITNSAQIYTDSLLKDTGNWVEIQGSFIADSAYQYVLLGNFFDDSTTDTLNCWGSMTYVFIDMVCVSTDSLLCDSPMEIKDLAGLKISIQPNPAIDFIRVKAINEPPNEIIVFDLFGNILFDKSDFVRTTEEIDIKFWPKGMLIVKIRHKGKNFYHKLIKQ